MYVFVISVNIGYIPVGGGVEHVERRRCTKTTTVVRYLPTYKHLILLSVKY